MKRFLPLTFLLLALALPAGASTDVTAEMKAVESIRGLTFPSPVTVKRMTRDQFRTFLAAQLQKDTPGTLPDFFASLRALQLLDQSGGDPLPKLLDLYQSQVLAFYDPSSHQYYQIIDPPKGSQLPSMAVRMVVIHELTHALQDQRFDAAKKMKAVQNDWDAQLAYQSVLEGEASFVMLAGLAETMGTSVDDLVKSGAVEQALTLTAKTNEGISADAPPYFVDSMKFPYVDGIRLIAAAWRKGGWDAISELDKNPPRSTSEVLHPDLYYAHQAPLMIDSPAPAPPSGHEILSTTLGEYHWKYLLGEEPATGWRGDRVRVFRLKNSALSVAIDSRWSDVEAAKRFAAAMGAFLKSRSIEAKVEGTGCDVRVRYVVSG